MTSHPEAPHGLLDPSFVPVRAAVASVELAGEVVLAGGGGTFYRLEPHAAIVWSCFDGSGTVEEIAQDLAGEFGTDVDRVRADVVRLATVLAALGLVRAVGGGDGLGTTPEASQELPQPDFLADPPSG